MSNEDVSSPSNGRVYRFDDIRIDSRTERVWKNDRLLHLEPKGYQLLCFLIETRGGLIEKQQLLDAVWGDAFVTENAMTRVVAQLRKALGDEAKAAKYIETVPKRGYRFVAEVKVELEPGAEVLALATERGRRRRWALGVVGVMVLAGVWFFASRHGPGPPPRTVPLTSYPGFEGEPALSPDGNFLAFTHPGESGTRDLLVQQIGGGSEPLAISAGAGDVFTPAWSPDGQHIAFIRHIDADEGLPTDGVFVVPLLGGAERQIGVLRSSHGLSWSPDSKLLAVPHRETPDSLSRIYLLSVETGEKRALTTPPPGVGLGDSLPRFSPDGGAVGFERGGAGPRDIYVVSIDSGEELRVTLEDSSIRGWDWAPDGDSIVFSLGRSGRVGFWSLWRVSVSGGEPEPLEVGNAAESPSISGRRLAYVRVDMNWSIWSIGSPWAGQETKSPERVIASTGLNYIPRYSPDGSRILFTSTRSGSLEIWVSDRDGSNPRQITFLEHPLTVNGSWSPDGEKIAFFSTKEGSLDIYSVSATGGFARRLTTGTWNEASPSWSRDGRSIYFASNRTGRFEIWKMPAEGGEGIQVTKTGGQDSFESHDGAYLYFAKQGPDGGPPGVWRMPLPEGEEELVLEDVRFGDWTFAEKGIYFINRAAQQGSTLEFFDFATGEVSPGVVLEPFPLPLWISVSPDERRILYVGLEEAESDIMLVENFR